MIQNSTSRYTLKRLKVYVHTKTYTSIFIAALFVTVKKNENNPNVQQLMINKTWYVHK